MPPHQPDSYTQWDYLRCPPSREQRDVSRRVNTYIPRQKDEASLKLSDNLYNYIPRLSSDTVRVNDPVTRTVKTVPLPEEAPVYNMPNLYPVPKPPAAPENTASRVVPRRTFKEIGPAESAMRYLDLAKEYHVHHVYRNTTPRNGHVNPGFYSNPTTFNPETRIGDGHPTVPKLGFRTLDVNKFARVANGRSPRSNPPPMVPMPPRNPIDSFVSKSADSLSYSQATHSAMGGSTYLPQKSLPPVQKRSKSLPRKQREEEQKRVQEKRAAGALKSGQQVQLDITVFEDRLQRLADREGKTLELYPPETPELEDEGAALDLEGVAASQEVAISE